MNLPDDALSFKDKPLFNIGTGTDFSIKELAELIKENTDFKGEIVFDTSKPDGTPQKLLDVSKLINLGWQAQIDLKQWINSVYALFMHCFKKREEKLCSLKFEKLSFLSNGLTGYMISVFVLVF